jgi:hypothetical protein
MIVGARNELRSTILTLILTSLKLNTQFVCGFACTLLNPAQIILDHFLTQNSFLKTCSQIGNLLLMLGALFDNMEKLTLERDTRFAWRRSNSVARRMIKFVLNIFNLNSRSLQIRSKQRTSGVTTKQCGMNFELSEFQPSTIKQTSNMRVYEPQIRIVNYDHIAVITWFDTHIIMRGSKRSNFRKKTLSSLTFSFLFSRKTLQSNLSWLQRAFSSSNTLKEIPSGDRSSLTSESESQMYHEDFP